MQLCQHCTVRAAVTAAKSPKGLRRGIQVSTNHVDKFQNMQESKQVLVAMYQVLDLKRSSLHRLETSVHLEEDDGNEVLMDMKRQDIDSRKKLLLEKYEPMFEKMMADHIRNYGSDNIKGLIAEHELTRRKDDSEDDDELAELMQGAGMT